MPGGTAPVERAVPLPEQQVLHAERRPEGRESARAADLSSGLLFRGFMMFVIEWHDRAERLGGPTLGGGTR